MADQDRDAVSLDDRDSPLRSRQRARRLCIVSSKPLLCSPFMAALRTVLTPHDELEIVVDRRRERVPTESRPDAAEPPSIDRRRHPQVDRNLKIDGFAIVPAPAAGLKARRSPISLLLPEVPVEEVWPEDVKDEERLELVRTFKRTHAGRLTMWLVLAGLISAVLILFAPSSAVKTLLSRLRPEASSSESLPVPLRLRIFDSAGRPLAGAEVLLRARMADSTEQSIVLDPGPEPGTYQATVPGGSAPVDLRVGITTSDKRVDIPLSP
jgi:hypothetical protein